MSVKVSKLLAIIMLFMAFAPLRSYAAEDYYSAEMVEEYNYRAEFLSALGIYGETIPDVSQKVSRAEFAGIVSRFKGFDIPSANKSGESLFGDVATDNENYAYIAEAVQSGLMTITGSNFYPNSAVSSKDALAALNKVLGYDRIYKNESTLATANRAKLTRGAEKYLNTPVTYGVLSIILTNALEANYVDDISEYKKTKFSENTVLEDWFKITEAEGVVTAASPTDLLRKGTVNADSIRINDVIYSVNKSYSDYLGLKVTYYYDGESNLIFARPKKNANTEKIIYSENLKDFNNKEYTYTETGSMTEKKTKIDYDCFIIYNNSPESEIEKTMLLPADGYIRLIDNDGDGKADVLFIMEYKVIDINLTDKTDYIIYDKNKTENRLDLKNAYDNGALYISDSSGYELKFEELSAGDVVIAYISKDEEIVRLELLSDSISGTVNAYAQDDNIRIGGVTYETAACFNWEDVKMSVQGKIYLDTNGKAVYFQEKSNPEMQIGYMIRCAYESGEEKLWAKILDSNGEIVNLSVAKPVSVNDSSYKNYQAADDEINRNVKGNLIRYKLNEKGELRNIYTAVSYETAVANGEEDAFRLSYPRQIIKYINSQKSMYGSYNISSDTLVFVIPEDDLSDYDSYKTLDRSYFQNTVTYDIEAYNYGEGDVVPDAVVVYESGRSTRNMHGVVSDVIEQVVEDGEIKQCVTVIGQWSTMTLYADDKSVIGDTGVGDFVTVSYDVDNKIHSVECVFDYSEDKYMKAVNPTEGFALNKRFAFGQVYEKTGSVIGISYDEITGVPDRSRIEACDTSLFVIYKMDETLKHPVPIKASAEDIKDYKHFAGECSKVVIMTGYEEPQMVMIY